MKWFVLQNANEQGPYSGSQIKQLAASGQLNKTDLVRREDQPISVPAEQVKGLFSEAQQTSATPSPTPAAPSSVGTQRMGQSTEDKTVSVTGNSEPEVKEESTENAPEPQGLDWFIKQNGVERGPFAFPDLQAFAQDGRLIQGDLVARKGQPYDYAQTVHGLVFPQPRSISPNDFKILAGILIGLTVLWWYGCTGNTDGGRRKIYDELPLVGGHSQQEVLEMLGKPDSIHNGPMLMHNGKYLDDEVWTYYKILKHEITGQLQDVTVHFKNKKCLRAMKD